MRNLKRALSLTLASVMLLGMMVVGSSALSFNDADDISNVTAATVLEELGVMQGDGKGNFMPEQTVTRAQMAILICRILYGDKLNVRQFEGVTQYTDVPTTEYYTGYINLATQLGIINGYGDGRFGPDDTVTTAQAALMLSRTLGYFQANELAEASDWALASVAQATKINMFGDLKLATNELLARDNVCEMVFNTMTKAVPVHYSERWDVYYTDNQSILNGINFRYIDTLAYQNFDLVYNADTNDDFNRPVTEWGIGTIRGGSAGLDEKGDIAQNSGIIKTSFVKDVNDADATYTKKVKVGDIYKDLGLNETVAAANVRVFIDGAEVNTVGGDDNVNAIRKGDDDNEYGNNGVLTQVFYFPGSRTNTTDRIVITEVNTWTGEVSRSVAASGTKDAYIVIATETDRPSGANGTENFETDATYENDTRVLYTYSQATDAIVDVAVAESLSGIVTRSENSNTNDADKKALTIDGTRYASSANISGETIGDVTVKNDYTIYLDNYGYMIYVEESEVGIGNYALVITTAQPNSFVGNRARLLKADGTIENVTTDKDYSQSPNTIAPYTIVTFRVDNDNVYSLRKVAATQSFKNKNNAGPLTTGALEDDDYADAFAMTNDKAGITVDAAAEDYAGTTVTSPTFTANSATAFVVADVNVDGTGSDFTAYTGIKNAPTITMPAVPANDRTDGLAAYWFCKGVDSRMVTVMFIFPGANVTVEDGNTSLIFIAKDSVSNLIHDADGDYYEYDAVVGDQIQKDIKVDGEVKVDGALLPTTVAGGADKEYSSQSAATKGQLNGLFKSSSVDKYGVITGLKTYATYTTGEKESVLTGTGIDKTSKEYTLILDTAGTPKTITADENCKYYYVDEDGNISTSSYRGVAIDNNDLVYAVVKDWMVQVLVVEEVANPSDVYSVSFANAATLAGNVNSNIVLTSGISNIAKDGAVSFTLTPKDGITIEDVQVSGGTLTVSGNNYTISGITKNITVTVTTSGTVVGYNGDLNFDISVSGQAGTVTADWTGRAKPTYAEMYNEVLEELVKRGYDKNGLEDSSVDGTSVIFKATKRNGVNIASGSQVTFTFTYATGLEEVAAAASQAELDAALAGSADKIKLSANATINAVPAKPIEVASRVELTVSGDRALTQDITGAGKVITSGDITAAEHIKTTGGVVVAATKTLTAGGNWAIQGDITGAGKVSVAGNAITNGDKIKCTGGLAITNAGGSVDKLSGVPLTIGANITSLTTGRVAPSALTMTGTIAFDSATAELVIPASATLMGITIGDTNGGKITLGANATVPASTAIALGNKGILDLNGKTLSGGASASTITTGTGAKIVGASGNTQNFFTDAGDGTRVANDEAAVQSKTFTYGAAAGGTGVAGWAHA